MPISIDRRNAFQRSFHQYPAVLEQFSRANMRVINPFDKESRERSLTDAMQIMWAMEICMAQFMVRLIQTRCLNAGPSMENFANKTVERYHTFKLKRIGGLEYMADAKYRHALTAIEQDFANIIFSALEAEASIILVPNKDGVVKDDDWDEISFWHDVFLALCANTRPLWPKWHIVAQEIFLDHKDEFAAAIEASNTEAANDNAA